MSDGRVADVVHEVTRALSPASSASDGESISCTAVLTPSLLLARPALAAGFPVRNSSAAATRSVGRPPDAPGFGVVKTFRCSKRSLAGRTKWRTAVVALYDHE